jgi:hypothetical protein
MGEIRGKVSRMSPLTRQILKQKQERRNALAQLSYPEKVRIVEMLREAAKKIGQVARHQGLR